jgi:hypothetical protein
MRHVPVVSFALLRDLFRNLAEEKPSNLNVAAEAAVGIGGKHKLRLVLGAYRNIALTKLPAYIRVVSRVHHAGTNVAERIPRLWLGVWEEGRRAP